MRCKVHYDEGEPTYHIREFDQLTFELTDRCNAFKHHQSEIDSSELWIFYDKFSLVVTPSQ